MKFVLWLLISIECMAAPPAWIDLPNDDLALLSRFEDERFSELNRRNDCYHRLEKTNSETLSERIVQLGEIVEYLDQWRLVEMISYKRTFLESIRIIAANKKWYLEKLWEGNSLSPPATEHLRWKPLQLVDCRYYDARNGMYWGEYSIEILDPCHRQLTTYHDRWVELKKNNSTIPPFFFWLEGENLSRNIPYVIYLNSEERMKLKTCADSGLLRYEQTEALVDCHPENEEYIFIIDLNEDLYITEGSEHISHTSLSHGMSVLGAGNIRVKNGIVESLGFVSGHYLPTISDGVQMIEILIEKNIPFSKNSKIVYFHKLEMQEISLNLFISRFCSESD